MQGLAAVVRKVFSPGRTANTTPSGNQSPPTSSETEGRVTVTSPSSTGSSTSPARIRSTFAVMKNAFSPKEWMRKFLEKQQELEERTLDDKREQRNFNMSIATLTGQNKKEIAKNTGNIEKLNVEQAKQREDIANVKEVQAEQTKVQAEQTKSAAKNTKRISKLEEENAEMKEKLSKTDKIVRTLSRTIERSKLKPSKLKPSPRALRSLRGKLWGSPTGNRSDEEKGTLSYSLFSMTHISTL